jgi:hypothetical protein
MVASGVPTSAVASERAVSTYAPASCAPTCAEPSLSKPCDEIVAAGNDSVHCPFTSGKMSLSVFCSSAPVRRRRNGRPFDGPEQSSWKFGLPLPAVPVLVLPAVPAVPGLPLFPAVPGPLLPALPVEPAVPVGLSAGPAPAHADPSASAASGANHRRFTTAPPGARPSVRGR